MILQKSAASCFDQKERKKESLLSYVVAEVRTFVFLVSKVISKKENSTSYEWNGTQGLERKEVENPIYDIYNAFQKKKWSRVLQHLSSWTISTSGLFIDGTVV